MTQKQMARLYWFVFALHLGVLWWFPFFPSQDGPTHVYNTAILRDLRNGGSEFGAFFDLKLFFTPNLGAILPLYFLAGVFPPMVAEKLFLSLFFGLLVGVMPRLLQIAGNHPFPASFLAF